eukprot:g21927.t1
MRLSDSDWDGVMRFENRTVIVTGGSKGIGEGCSRVFCQEGGSVAILARGKEAGLALAEELTQNGPGKALFIQCDVSVPGQLQEAIETTVAQFGRLDCIINNAGAHPPATSIDDTSLDEMEALMRLNYLSTFAGAKFALPHLRKTKGTIINISSMTAVLGQDQSSAYCATKAAQVGLTKALAVELGREGIRVNAILPSNIDTPLMRDWAATLPDPESALNRVSALQVFDRMGTIEEMGRVALFLATEDSSFVTGQAIEAEGGLITVAVLFVVAEGLQQTGGVSFAGQRLLGQPRGLRSAQTRLMLPAAAMSAFMNNTPVVAMTMPIVGDWAKKYRLSVTHLLMPLSYAAILGGLCTLVGTSTTLIVNGLLIRENHPGLGMFEVAWVGVPAAVIGLVYLLACTKWLLPERRPAIQQLNDPREYTVEMIVEPASPLIGKTIEEAGLRHLPGMYLIEIDRDGHILAAVASSERLLANDRLIFVGIVESVVDLRKIPGLKPAADQQFQLTGRGSDRCLVEAVVSNSCPYLHTTIRDAHFRSHYNAAVIAVARDGRRIRKKIGDIRLMPGDTLLLEATPGFLELQRNSRDFFLVSRVENSTPPRHERAWIARTILLAMVVVVAAGTLSMLKAAMAAAGLMIVTRCCRGSEAKRSIDLGVLLTIGAGLGIGKSLEVSGAATILAEYLIHAIGQRPLLTLGVIYLVTMVLTNIITAKAAAVLLFPIAVAAAHSLNADIMPFTMGVVVAAAASFATPIGYQTNLMVYGPGGYRISDFLRVGGPLSLLVAVVSIAIIPFVWPFFPAN